jgi:hypothetical protein
MRCSDVLNEIIGEGKKRLSIFHLDYSYGRVFHNDHKINPLKTEMFLV